MAKVWNVQLRKSIGHTEDEPVPPGIDYETWTGPLPKLPFNRNRFHGTVNWHWHYGCGDIANDGVHELNIARRALGVGLPEQISGMGRKMYFDDDQQTPDTMNITTTKTNCCFTSSASGIRMDWRVATMVWPCMVTSPWHSSVDFASTTGAIA